MTINKTYLLNIGLAFTLLYAGIMSFVNPYDWVGFVPAWFGNSREIVMHLHSVSEIILGLWLLSNFKIKWAAILTAIDMLAIIFGNGISANILLITFRDIALLFTALFLAIA